MNGRGAFAFSSYCVPRMNEHSGLFARRRLAGVRRPAPSQQPFPAPRDEQQYSNNSRPSRVSQLCRTSVFSLLIWMYINA
jgi:hypothetical protein